MGLILFYHNRPHVQGFGRRTNPYTCPFLVGCLNPLPPKNQCTGCFAPAHVQVRAKEKNETLVVPYEKSTSASQRGASSSQSLSFTPSTWREVNLTGIRVLSKAMNELQSYIWGTITGRMTVKTARNKNTDPFKRNLRCTGWCTSSK